MARDELSWIPRIPGFSKASKTWVAIGGVPVDSVAKHRGFHMAVGSPSSLDGLNSETPIKLEDLGVPQF